MGAFRKGRLCALLFQVRSYDATPTYALFWLPSDNVSCAPSHLGGFRKGRPCAFPFQILTHDTISCTYCYVCLQTAFRLPSDCLQTAFRLPSDCLQTAFRLLSDNVSYTFNSEMSRISQYLCSLFYLTSILLSLLDSS